MIPDGYAAYGWHSFAGGGLRAVARLSAAHLVPVDQVRVTPRGERVDGSSLCGRSERSGRYNHRDSPGMVVSELARGERKPCQRCFKKAGEATT